MSLKSKRTLLSLLFIVTVSGLPLGILSLRYELWDLKDSRKFGLFTTFLIIIALVSMRKFLWSRIKALNYGIPKTIVVIFAALIPSILLYSLSMFVNNYAYIFVDVLQIISFTQIFAWTFIYPFIMNLDYNINKEIRKKEMIEAIRAAGDSNEE